MRPRGRFKPNLYSQLPPRLRHFCEWQMLIILLFIFFGDAFKWGDLFNITQYNWIQGHFSDIGLTAQCTTALYYLFGHRSRSIPFAFALPPLAFTCYEIMQYPHTDYVDIACYVAGSAMALGSIAIRVVLSR